MKTHLPWSGAQPPLMLAPMQGVTNCALRSLFIEKVRPDVVCTEFMRVGSGNRRGLSLSDRRELAADDGRVPLLVQLIGFDPQALVAAAERAQSAGASHLNINLGCPYGRTTSGPTGGSLLKEPERLPAILHGLRRVCRGSFSVKVRAGYDDAQQIFALLPLFEDAGIDFLILHPRTVVQKYEGFADHLLTAEVVRRTRLPVIANGDIDHALSGQRLLAETGVAGLMLGRGAIADPYLFTRLRGLAPHEPQRAARADELRAYLSELLGRYEPLFCGEAQILAKTKEVLHYIREPWMERPIRRLRKARTLSAFRAAMAGIA